MMKEARFSFSGVFGIETSIFEFYFFGEGEWARAEHPELWELELNTETQTKNISATRSEGKLSIGGCT